MSTVPRTIPVGGVVSEPSMEAPLNGHETSAPLPPAQPNGQGPTVEEIKETRVFQTPLIDIHESPDGLVLEADLPGGTEEGVSIQLADNVLTLHVKIAPQLPEGAKALHEEYRPADFFRSFILSDEVERSKISADLKNGVLRLTLPKADRAKTRRIEIKS